MDDLSTTVMPRETPPPEHNTSNLPQLISAALIGATLTCAGIFAWLYFFVVPSGVPASSADMAVGLPTTPLIEDSILVGTHAFSIQWIETGILGEVSITRRGTQLVVSGEQRDVKTGDFVTIEGTITETGPDSFSFKGILVTRINHINAGRPCVREGGLNFQKSGRRNFWRMREMRNPCTGMETDYVDIYF